MPIVLDVKPASPNGYRNCCCDPQPVGVGVGVGVGGDGVGVGVGVDGVGVGGGCSCARGFYVNPIALCTPSYKANNPSSPYPTSLNTTVSWTTPPIASACCWNVYNTSQEIVPQFTPDPSLPDVNFSTHFLTITPVGIPPFPYLQGPNHNKFRLATFAPMQTICGVATGFDASLELSVVDVPYSGDPFSNTVQFMLVFSVYGECFPSNPLGVYTNTFNFVVYY
jgi:hypothetical protein